MISIGGITMQCPKCHSLNHVKSGFTYGKQRYKCKSCACHFTQSHKRGAPLETKKYALKLYLEGNGFRAIGRLMGISNVTALNWIRELGKSAEKHIQLQPPIPHKHIKTAEIDEMWHFTRKKNENYGYGSL